MTIAQSVPFVTCDLLDDHPDTQVCSPSMDGKFFRNFGGRKSFGGEIVTVKCFEDNSRVKELLATEGAGLGLYIAQQFVQMHGGRIWAESPGLGKGATIKLLLPFISTKALQSMKR